MIKKALTLIALIGATLSLNAELKILTVDMGEIYNNYHLAQEAQAKFNTDVEEAQEEIRQMIDEGRSLAEKYQEVVANANNPAFTEDARGKFRTEAEDIQMKIRRKETEVNNFKQQTDQILAARRQSALNLSVEKIKEVVNELAAQYGADLVLNSNGLGVVYFKPENDITKSVLEILNADKAQQ